MSASVIVRAFGRVLEVPHRPLRGVKILKKRVDGVFGFSRVDFPPKGSKTMIWAINAHHLTIFAPTLLMGGVTPPIKSDGEK